MASLEVNRFIALLGLTIVFINSCTESPDDPRIIRLTDAGSRIIDINQVVTWDTTVTLGKMAGRPTDSLLLILETEVLPPALNGLTLQASDICISGNKAYVSYNLQGESFGGGVDVFDISDPGEPEHMGGILIEDSDVNGIFVHGNDLYLATAKRPGGAVEYAALEHLNLEGGLPETDSEIINLPSWAATDVVVSGDNIFVTTGAEGGYVCILTRSSYAFLDSIQVDDARGVAAENQQVAVIAGTPARVLIFDGDSGELLNQYQLEGATIPYSKSTIEVIGDKAIVGIGDGGTNIVCLADGSLTGSLAAPIVSGLPAELTVTNAATAQGDMIFMANGEAGVYAGQTGNRLSANNCNTGEFSLVGKLMFDDDQSVNHIVYRSDMLFIAGGLGGLKIVSIDD